MPNKKEPTPIRKQPEPLIFPKQSDMDIGSSDWPVDTNELPRPQPVTQQLVLQEHDSRLRAIIREEITKALYAVGTYDPEPNIASMTPHEFEAFMAAVWSEEEA